MSGQVLENLSVMVIDDQKTMRSIIRQLLHQLGIKKITEANNGELAIKLSQAARYSQDDIIICDLYMDQMDGMEFLTTVRRNKTGIHPGTPIIILTGEDDDFVLDVIHQVGATVVLKKPVTSDDLFNEIEKALGFSLDR